MATGNTFGATALSSYGGFWIGTAIILTPGGFEIASSLSEESATAFADSFGIYLFGWFIFTFLLLICTLRSTVAFFTLFFTLDLAFLFLGSATSTTTPLEPPTSLSSEQAVPLVFSLLSPHGMSLILLSCPSLHEYSLIIKQVQRPCRYRRPQQLLLHHSRRPLPVVRQGPREAQQGRQQRGPQRCLNDSNVYMMNRMQ